MNEYRHRAAGGDAGATQFRRGPWEIKRLLPAMLLGMLVMLASGCGGDSGTNPEPVTPAPSAGGTTTPPATGGGGTTTPPTTGGGGTTTPPATGGGTTTPPATGGGTTTPASIIPTWYGVQANVLQQYCTVCHSGANPPAGLSWEVGQYQAIVTNARMSTEIATLREVNPGNPDASYLLWKLRGQGPAGQTIQGVRMPAFGAALDPALVAVVEQWIRAGAPLGTPADAASGGTTTPPATGGGTTTPPATGGGTTTPPATGGGTTTPASIIPTWYGVQANVLQQYCTICHNGANPPAGLSWEVGQYDAIVTNARMSTEIATLREVNPGNPDASYLLWKLRAQGPAGQTIQGARMPAIGPALSAELIAVVEQWIRDGAPLGTPADAAASGTPAPTTGVPASAITATWWGVQVNILQRACTACHDNYEPQAGLSWEPDQYRTLITGGRMSTQMPTMREIEPGNPDASYMMWKLRGHGPAGQAIAGARMPATGIPLDPALIEVVERWIRNGAPEGTVLDANAGGTVGPTYPVGSWMYVWTEALQVCSMCHNNAPANPRCGVDFQCPPKGIVITADNYSGVVDGNLVRPSSPAQSKLWQRISETSSGPRMPLELKPLAERQLGIVYDWIANGAPLCPANAVCP